MKKLTCRKILDNGIQCGKTVVLFGRVNYCKEHARELNKKNAESTNKRRKELLPEVLKGNMKCSSKKCTKGNPKAVFLRGYSPLCEDCKTAYFEMKNSSAKKTYKKHSKQLKKGLALCATLSCKDKGILATKLFIKKTPKCDACYIKSIELQQLRQKQLTIKRSVDVDYKNHVKMCRQEKRKMYLSNSYSIVRIIAKFADIPIQFSILNFREELAREVIFMALEKITKIGWINEKSFALSSLYNKQIDVLIPTMKLIIETKNTYVTQFKKDFYFEMVNHFNFIRCNKFFKNYKLISMSVDGSMGDSNVRDFIEKYYLNNKKIKLTIKAKKQLKDLIAILDLNKDLFSKRIWNDLTTPKIIKQAKIDGLVQGDLLEQLIKDNSSKK